jgi:arsenate reductase
MNLYPELTNYIATLSEVVIEKERQAILDEVVEYIESSDQPKLNFICTHNSRRSHLSQIWAQTLAFFFNRSIETFSGGTESTTFHPNAVDALKRAGFRIENPGGDNPHYQIYFSDQQAPLTAYSKKFDDPENPSSGFAALMTCSEADEACPIVFGASRRIKLFYEDPKIADTTPEEKTIYDERCRQIAAEMYYVFRIIEFL